MISIIIVVVVIRVNPTHFHLSSIGPVHPGLKLEAVALVNTSTIIICIYVIVRVHPKTSWPEGTRGGGAGKLLLILLLSSLERLGPDLEPGTVRVYATNNGQ